MTASYQPQRRSRPGRGAELGAEVAQPGAVLVEQLGRERPGADAGGVGLDDADHPADPGGADAGAGADAAGGRVAGGDERVGAVVDVEHRGLGALEEHRLVLVERVVDHPRGVGDERLDLVLVGADLLEDLVDLDGAPVVDLHQQVVLLLERGLDLLGEDLLVEDVGDPDAHAVDLVGVGRPDPAARRTDLVLAEEALGDLVDRGVVARDQVRVAREQQPAGVDAAGVEALDLLEQHRRVDHDAVADDRGDPRGEDAGGQQVQGELLAVDDDGVPGIVSALVADAIIKGGTELVGRLALAFVTPLGSDEDDRGHPAPLSLAARARPR